jgi:NADH:ubiquinone oxidoreductase subunit H
MQFGWKVLIPVAAVWVMAFAVLWVVVGGGPR